MDSTDRLHSPPSLWTDLRLGFLHFIPVGAVIFGYAVVFGLLASGSGLSVAQACLMSLTVFAGASQFMALPMIRKGASIGALTAMALVVNLRHLLYGLNIGLKFKGAPLWKLMGVSFGIVDETYAFATVGPGRRLHSIPYFMGTALCAYILWNAGTLVGAAAGKWTPSLSSRGLDFAMVAVFIAMVGSSVKKATDWLVVGLSVVIALAVYRWAGGYWHLFAAGLLAPLAVPAIVKEADPER
ncbi:MAG: AzlC family ABC transporter permease [Proteobacteria bacterium]|nr:AzlC family ABC transporter permease [Pseudomonadota bacterium]